MVLRVKRGAQFTAALLVTAVAIWWTFRSVDLSGLLGVLADTDLGLVLAISVPAFLLNFFCRTLRWQILTRDLGELSFAAHFRAVAVGFMANNLLPFRVGELARCWVLARGSAVGAPALFGTVVVERLFDFAGLGFLAFCWMAARGTGVVGGTGSYLLGIALVVFVLPLLLVLVLQWIPGPRVAGFAGRILGGSWPQLGERLSGFLEELIRGGRSLRDPRAFGRVFALTLVCWLLASVPPFWAALRGVGWEAGAAELLEAAGAMTVWVAAGVAVPSVPGFFGPYHAACWLALEAYGVPKATAVAVGTVAHLTFWTVTTGVGLLSLRVAGTSLREARSALRPTE